MCSRSRSEFQLAPANTDALVLRPQCAQPPPHPLPASIDGWGARDGGGARGPSSSPLRRAAPCPSGRDGCAEWRWGLRLHLAHRQVRATALNSCTRLPLVERRRRRCLPTYPHLSPCCRASLQIRASYYGTDGWSIHKGNCESRPPPPCWGRVASGTRAHTPAVLIIPNPPTPLPARRRLWLHCGRPAGGLGRGGSLGSVPGLSGCERPCAAVELAAHSRRRRMLTILRPFSALPQAPAGAATKCAATRVWWRTAMVRIWVLPSRPLLMSSTAMHPPQSQRSLPPPQ